MPWPAPQEDKFGLKEDGIFLFQTPAIRLAAGNLSMPCARPAFSFPTLEIMCTGKNAAGTIRVMVASPLLAVSSFLDREQDLRGPYKHFSEDAVVPRPCLAVALHFHHEHVLPWSASLVRTRSFSSEGKIQNPHS